ncbi:MAG: AraC family transcriptional regulator [Roseitalea sp.]|uniref:AraC family transcriptional regulator n=2 Tax=Oceaniradius stylonematis TaxID=2184161 RepID=A0A3A8A815_9HYPH|nr:AraC family transcriptional regulator [Roseitalea sp.]MBO6670004.1 AraC family transcriptional regulator [Roseitalea sp.]MBO6950436.1 AraC family transcriptional regulator [Rhizobiaceae bacterium]RKF05528.1 AraC family transcriptional regulator [Oceaniradius stylonematis]
MYKTRMQRSYHPQTVRISHYYLPDAELGGGLTTVLRAGWLDAAPGGTIRRAACPGDDILYCLSGRGQVEVGERRFDLGAGQLAWIAGDAPHGHSADRRDPWSVMWFRLDGPHLAALRRRIFGKAPPRLTIAEGPELIGWFQNLFAILDAGGADMDLRLHAATAEFFKLVSSQRDPRARTGLPSRLDRLRQMIVANPEQPWSAEVMTQIAGVSASQLRRLFRQHLKATPRAYLRHQRLAMAQRMMLESTLPLQDIAVRCGFCDGYHFSRDFKRVVGRAPTEWRRMELGR